jgi:hypothetical protein
MKKLLVILLLLNAGIAFSQSATKVNLDNLTQVTFPGKPADKGFENQKVYFLKDSTAYYLALSKNMSKLPGFSLQKDSLNEFYTGIIEGTVKTAGGKLIYKKDILIDGFKAIEFEYTLTNPNLPALSFQRSIFLNGKIISCNFMTSEENLKTNEPKRDAFFKSITVTADKSTIKQSTGADTAFKVGYSIGYIIGVVFSLAVLIAIIVGVVFLIKRISKGKKHESA